MKSWSNGWGSVSGNFPRVEGLREGEEVLGWGSLSLVFYSWLLVLCLVGLGLGWRRGGDF